MAEPEQTEATLTLLRLGRDSVPALLGLFGTRRRSKSRVCPSRRAGICMRASWSLSQALDLLMDIGDFSVVRR